MAKGDRFLENLVIEGRLGRGGMGEVYLARDEWLEQEVAAKLIHRKFADLPAFVERFRRDAKALTRLVHPNIVRVHYAGQAPPPDGRFYMIMDRLEGITLRVIIDTTRERGGLDPVSAIIYGLQTAEAVGIAHAKRILHRDIRPENIFVGERGHVWVLDFGLATKEMTTARYMSPEQIQGHSPDARADLYAIGVVLYEMVAGVHPHAIADEPGADDPGIMAAHAYAAPRPLVELVPDCPASFYEIVTRCLAKERDARYQSADDLAADLRAVLRTHPPGNPVARQAARERAHAARKKALPVEAYPSLPRADVALPQEPSAQPSSAPLPRAEVTLPEEPPARRSRAPLPRANVAPPEEPAARRASAPLPRAEVALFEEQEELEEPATQRASAHLPPAEVALLEEQEELEEPATQRASAHLLPAEVAPSNPGQRPSAPVASSPPPNPAPIPTPAAVAPQPRGVHPPPRRIHPPPRRVSLGASVGPTSPAAVAPAPAPSVPDGSAAPSEGQKVVSEVPDEPSLVTAGPELSPLAILAAKLVAAQPKPVEQTSSHQAPTAPDGSTIFEVPDAKGTKR